MKFQNLITILSLFIFQSCVEAATKSQLELLFGCFKEVLTTHYQYGVSTQGSLYFSPINRTILDAEGTDERLLACINGFAPNISTILTSDLDKEEGILHKGFTQALQDAGSHGINWEDILDLLEIHPKVKGTPEQRIDNGTTVSKSSDIYGVSLSTQDKQCTGNTNYNHYSPGTCHSQKSENISIKGEAIGCDLLFYVWPHDGCEQGIQKIMFAGHGHYTSCLGYNDVVSWKGECYKKK